MPATVGVNVTCTVQELPAATVVQLFVCVKSPDASMLLTVSDSRAGRRRQLVRQNGPARRQQSVRTPRAVGEPGRRVCGQRFLPVARDERPTRIFSGAENMPSYRGNLKPEELASLLAFLASRHRVQLPKPPTLHAGAP